MTLIKMALIKMTLWLILGGWIAVVYKLAVKHPLIAALVPVILVALGSATAIYKF